MRRSPSASGTVTAEQTASVSRNRACSSSTASRCRSASVTSGWNCVSPVRIARAEGPSAGRAGSWSTYSRSSASIAASRWANVARRPVGSLLGRYTKQASAKPGSARRGIASRASDGLRSCANRPLARPSSSISCSDRLRSVMSTTSAPRPIASLSRSSPLCFTGKMLASQWCSNVGSRGSCPRLRGRPTVRWCRARVRTAVARDPRCGGSRRRSGAR